jgi:small basic protein (TIGR04137 family)
MSIDKSLRRKNSLLRARSVLTRDERIKTLMDTDRWVEDRSPYGLPKVRVLKIVKKKAPKEKAAEAVPGAEGAAAEGAPAAAGKAATGKAPAGKAAPAAKPAGKK